MIGGIKHLWKWEVLPWLGQRGRWATTPLRQFPDFVIIGAQGGGTTSTYAWLRTHPQFRQAAAKEVHFFDIHYARGLHWYRAQFPVKRRGTVTGEATPYLYLHPLAAERAARDLPRTTKFVLFLRNPADRAISRYRRAFALGDEMQPIERAFALEQARMEIFTAIATFGESYVHRNLSYMTGGHYAPLLRRWQEQVGADRIAVFEMEQMTGSDETRQQFLSYVGLDPFDGEYPYKNSFSKSNTDLVEVRRRLEEHFAPQNEELFSLLGRRLWGK